MKLNNITKVYHNKHNIVEALKDVQIEFEKCGMHFIVGPSGSGKTTLLNIISGKEKDYVGEIENRDSVEFIEQEFVLFEAMTVMDNLLIVDNDVQKIKDFLEKFNLSEQENQTVKKLSNGQKKRLQIIRSLLVSPQILLCDEPTAALDYENTEMIMQLLKEWSQHICVIVVTHERNIADQYADRIIEIDNGEIVVDKKIQDTETLVVSHQKKSNNRKYFPIIKKDILSRKSFSLANMILLLLVMVCVYSSLSVFVGANNQVSNNFDYYYGKNILLSTPIDPESINEGYAEKFDSFTYAKIREIIDQVPEIYAYNFGFDNNFYSYAAKGTMKYPECNTKTVLDSEGNIIEYSFKDPAMPYVRINRDTISARGMVYQLLNEDISLYAGNYPTKDNEAVVSYDTATMLCKENGITLMEDLIGETFEILIPSDSMGDVYPPEPFTDLTVTGITPYSNRYEYQIFMKDGAYNKFFDESYTANMDDWNFDYLSLMFSPDVDIETVMAKVNKIYQGNESDFRQKDYASSVSWNTKIAGTVNANQQEMSLSLLLRVNIIVVIVVLFIYVFMQYVHNKRKNKESYILKRYDYQPLTYHLLKDTVFVVVAAILFVMISIPLCIGLNAMINSIFEGSVLVQLFDWNILQIMITFALCIIFIILEEGLFYVFSFKKYK